MGNDRSEEADGRASRRRQSVGGGWQRMDDHMHYVRDGCVVTVTEIRLRRKGSGWQLIVKAKLDAVTSVIAFRDVERLFEVADAIYSILSAGKWKPDLPFDSPEAKLIRARNARIGLLGG